MDEMPVLDCLLGDGGLDDVVVGLARGELVGRPCNAEGYQNRPLEGS